MSETEVGIDRYSCGASVQVDGGLPLSIYLNLTTARKGNQWNVVEPTAKNFFSQRHLSRVVRVIH